MSAGIAWEPWRYRLQPKPASRLHKDNRNLVPGVVVAKDQLDGHAAVWLRLAEKQVEVIVCHGRGLM